MSIPIFEIPSHPSTSAGRLLLVTMVLVGCCLVPSWPGGLSPPGPPPPSAGLLDLDLLELPDSAEQLHISAKQLGDWVVDQRPDLLMLISHQVTCVFGGTTCSAPTPPLQGVGLSDTPALLTGATARGSARLHGKVGDRLET